MPLPSTMTPIATTTLSTTSNNITFSSISSVFTDLVMVINAGNSAGTDLIQFQFNGDTGSNYSRILVLGNGTSAITTASANQNYTGVGLLGSVLSPNIFHFMNYSNTTTYKTVLARNDVPNDQTRVTVGMWRSTAAISTISLTMSPTSFTSGSTFTLYGIKAAS